MLLLALVVLFFGSGVSALIYQVLWVRVLGWVFGVTVFAASTVWACFMAGLAIGSLVAGRAADRTRNPIRWFGLTEVLIGLTALSTPLMLRVLERGYVGIYPSLPHSLPALTLVRFAIAFSVLIVPTALMGATLPLVIKSSEVRRGHLGAHVGILYGANTFGAIVGTLAAGLSLIPGRGIHGTFIIASSLNLLVGTGGIVLSFLVRPEAEPVGASIFPTRTSAKSMLPPADRRLQLVLVVFALSGLVSLGLEVVWFRVLTLFLRPTVYGFAIMLATILAGIALGSWLITPILDRKSVV